MVLQGSRRCGKREGAGVEGQSQGARPAADRIEGTGETTEGYGAWQAVWTFPIGNGKILRVSKQEETGLL